MRIVTQLFLLLFLITQCSCKVVEGIFSTGIWTGVLVVVAIAALLTLLLAKLIDK